jgi:hypothetical protein
MMIYSGRVNFAVRAGQQVADLALETLWVAEHPS